jgi:hypothetical protein
MILENAGMILFVVRPLPSSELQLSMKRVPAKDFFLENIGVILFGV